MMRYLKCMKTPESLTFINFNGAKRMSKQLAIRFDTLYVIKCIRGICRQVSVMARSIGLPQDERKSKNIKIIDVKLQVLRMQATKLNGPTQIVQTMCIPRQSYLKLSPPSVTSYCSPAFKLDMYVLRWASSRACQMLSSEYSPTGSKFMRKLPENNTGS